MMKNKEFLNLPDTDKHILNIYAFGDFLSVNHTAKDSFYSYIEVMRKIENAFYDPSILAIKKEDRFTSRLSLAIGRELNNKELKTARWLMELAIRYGADRMLRVGSLKNYPDIGSFGDVELSDAASILAVRSMIEELRNETASTIKDELGQLISRERAFSISEVENKIEQGGE
jgi:hypothetical protein